MIELNKSIHREKRKLFYIVELQLRKAVKGAAQVAQRFGAACSLGRDPGDPGWSLLLPLPVSLPLCVCVCLYE